MSNTCGYYERQIVLLFQIQPWHFVPVISGEILTRPLKGGDLSPSRIDELAIKMISGKLAGQIEPCIQVAKDNGLSEWLLEGRGGPSEGTASQYVPLRGHCSSANACTRYRYKKDWA